MIYGRKLVNKMLEEIHLWAPHQSPDLLSEGPPLHYCRPCAITCASTTEFYI